MVGEVSDGKDISLNGEYVSFTFRVYDSKTKKYKLIKYSLDNPRVLSFSAMGNEIRVKVRSRGKVREIPYPPSSAYEWVCRRRLRGR